MKKADSQLRFGEVIAQEVDEQIRERQKEVKFDLKDYTIDFMVQEYHKDKFFIPSYQREFIWRPENRSKFIESVILGLPIPFMFVAELDDGRLEVVDGAQRLQTLESFLADDLTLERLDKLSALNGLTFSQLPLSQQRKFSNRALRIVVLEESTSEDIRKEIFKRINTTGVRARPSEVRRGAYAGAFMTFLRKCASDSKFKKLCPVSPSMELRKEREELILRFFAYSDEYRKFTHDVEKFLDNFVETHRDEYDDVRMRREFKAVLDFVEKFFPNGFAKGGESSITPRVRFEAIAVGTNLALRRRPDLVPRSMAWLVSPEFKTLTTTHASNSRPRLRARIEFVRDRLLGE